MNSAKIKQNWQYCKPPIITFLNHVLIRAARAEPKDGFRRMWRTGRCRGFASYCGRFASIRRITSLYPPYTRAV